MKNFLAFYWIRSFITAFASAHPLPIISQLDLVHTTTSHFLKIHLNIILPSMLGLSGHFISGFPTKTLYTPLLSPTRSTCPAHLSLLYLINLTIFGAQYRPLSPSLCRFLHSPVNTCHISRNNFLRTLFSNTLSLHFSLNISDHVSHPCKQQDNYISVFPNVYIFIAN